MQATVTLNSDAENLLKIFMARRRLTLDDAVNEAILRGLSRLLVPFEQEAHPLGIGQLWAEQNADSQADLSEDDEQIRKLPQPA